MSDNMPTDMQEFVDKLVEHLRTLPGFTDEMVFGIRCWAEGWFGAGGCFVSTPTPPGDLVERAKAALEGVTPGPWDVTGGVVWCGQVIAVPDPSDPTGQTPMPELLQEKVCDTAPGADAEFIAASRQLVPELVAEVERLHSWDGLMSLVDEHYPVDIFPTMEDRADRDPGPRIVSLLRVIDGLRAAVGLGPEPPACPGPEICDGRCGL